MTIYQYETISNLQDEQNNVSKSISMRQLRVLQCVPKNYVPCGRQNYNTVKYIIGRDCSISLTDLSCEYERDLSQKVERPIFLFLTGALVGIDIRKLQGA